MLVLPVDTPQTPGNNSEAIKPSQAANGAFAALLRSGFSQSVTASRVASGPDFAEMIAENRDAAPNPLAFADENEPPAPPDEVAARDDEPPEATESDPPSKTSENDQRTEANPAGGNGDTEIVFNTAASPPIAPLSNPAGPAVPDNAANPVGFIATGNSAPKGTTPQSNASVAAPEASATAAPEASRSSLSSSAPGASQSAPGVAQQAPGAARNADANYDVRNWQPNTLGNGRLSAQVTNPAQPLISRPTNTLAAMSVLTAQAGEHAPRSQAIAALTLQAGRHDPSSQAGATLTALAAKQMPEGQTRAAMTAPDAKQGPFAAVPADPAGKPEPLSGAAAAALATQAGKQATQSGTGFNTAEPNSENTGNLLLNQSGNKSANNSANQSGRGAQQSATPSNTGETTVNVTPQLPQFVASLASNQSAAARPAQTAAQPLALTPTDAGTGIPASISTPNGVARTAAPPPIRAAAPPPPVAEQIAIQIQKSVAQGVDRIKIQLKPAELGRIEIRLDIGQDGRVAAMITAERPDTLEQLQRDIRGLQQALQDAGLKADSNSLSFNLGGGNASGDEQADADESTNDHPDNSNDLAESDDNTAHRRASDSMIDVEV